MKKLLFAISTVLFVAIGCLPTPSTPNQPPIAYIDSVSKARISPGEAVTFTGHGVDPEGGSIAVYNWRSSIGGELSKSASFTTSSLSEGTHTIWFKVQDSNGNWSKEVFCTVVVLPSGVVMPDIYLFEADPPSIAKGESSTLRWNVSGASTVKIDPGVGNVASTGNRAVSPSKTTVYTLTAINEAGTNTATTGVAVTTLPIYTVELFSIAPEDGHVRRDGYVGPEPSVGDTGTDVAMQAFLSFDISAIPEGATIKSASLDLSSGQLFGSPFTMLGQLYIYGCQYSQLRASDFVVGPPIPGAIYSTPVMPTRPITSSRLTSAVQSQVDADSNRFQIRLQFEKYTFHYHVADYLALEGDGARLVIQYEY